MSHTFSVEISNEFNVFRDNKDMEQQYVNFKTTVTKAANFIIARRH